MDFTTTPLNGYRPIFLEMLFTMRSLFTTSFILKFNGPFIVVERGYYLNDVFKYVKLLSKLFGISR